jgi:NAD(P)-dependent dehydrogenase (short-subunit alcohol dehydrogenase family)
MRKPETDSELEHAIATEQLPITVVKLDVDDDTSVIRGVAEVFERAGHIDVLVNNAGVGMNGAIEVLSFEDAQRIFATNYFGAMRMVKAVLPSMRERRSGTIIMVSSTAGRVALACQGHYAASKHALEAASESLAQEVLGFNVRIAIIEPGIVRTAIFDKGRKDSNGQTPDRLTEYYDMHRRRLRACARKQLQNPTMPEEVAETIEFAMLNDQPQLRYRVGELAHVYIEGRQRMTDEAWVEIGQPMTDDEYYDVMLRNLGVDLFR